MTAIETAITLLAAVLLSVLVRAYAFETFFIPSGSMIPTLGVYDRVLVLKAFFDWHDVREGDIVVFAHLGDNRTLSCDSRYWGPVQGSSIVGKAIVVIWHDSHPELRGP